MLQASEDSPKSRHTRMEWVCPFLTRASLSSDTCRQEYASFWTFVLRAHDLNASDISQWKHFGPEIAASSTPLFALQVSECANPKVISFRPALAPMGHKADRMCLALATTMELNPDDLTVAE